jgi:hypothetical protein
MASVLIYQSHVDAHFWNNLTPDESMAGVFMGLSELAQLVVITGLGCFVGLILAGFVLSLNGRKRIVSILAYAGLLINGLPLLLGLGVLFTASR